MNSFLKNSINSLSFETNSQRSKYYKQFIKQQIKNKNTYQNSEENSKNEGLADNIFQNKEKKLLKYDSNMTNLDERIKNKDLKKLDLKKNSILDIDAIDDEDRKNVNRLSIKSKSSVLVHKLEY